MSITPMGAAASGGSDSGDNYQLATITAVNIFTGDVTCQIDGSDTTMFVRCDSTRRQYPPTGGDRILVTRHGSEMYEVMCVQSAYAFFYPNTAYASYGLTANQTITASTVTTVNFNSSLATRVLFAAPASGIFTIPQDGFYQIVARAAFAAATTTNTRRFAALIINGAISERVEQAANSTGQWVIQLADIRPFTAGDTVGLQVFHIDTVAKDVTAFDSGGVVNSTVFRIARVTGK